MPHAHSASRSTGSHMRAASQSRTSTGRALAESNGGPGQGETEKFPDFDAGHLFPSIQPSGPRWQQNGTNGSATHPERWHARRDSKVKWASREPISGSMGHRKTNSIVQRMRSASMSQNAHEIAEALRAPVSWRLVVCLDLVSILCKGRDDTHMLTPLARRPSVSCGTARRP
jgi:solute carrier family 35 protein E1